MDFILAHSRLQRRNFEGALKLCDQMLQKNPTDEAAWLLKCQCLVQENYINELETEEEGLADALLKDEDVNQFARGSTSFRNVGTSNPLARPMTGGRLTTGFQRPGTNLQSRSGTSMMKTARIATKAGQPITSNGRVLRLSTASLQQHGQQFFDIAKIDLKKLAGRKTRSRTVFNYLFHVEHNLIKAKQLATYATQVNKFEDPWWKLALGKCFYHLGLLDQAQKQLLSASKHNFTIEPFLYLSRIHHKKDSVVQCIKVIEQAQTLHQFEPRLWIEMGRIYDDLNDFQKSFSCYKQCLALQNCSLEAVANIAAYYYYKDQPQVSIKLYQRLIQLGMDSPQLWTNMGLCCYANHQLTLFYYCFQRALLIGTEDVIVFSDIWYNISSLFVAVSDIDTAVEALKTAITYNPQNQQALSNLAVLEYRRGNIQQAIKHSKQCCRQNVLFEAAFNLSVWGLQINDFEMAYQYNNQAYKIFPNHYDTLKIREQLSNHLQIL